MLALLTAWKTGGAPTEGQVSGNDDSLGLSFLQRGNLLPLYPPSLSFSHHFLRLMTPDGGEKATPDPSYHNLAMGARGCPPPTPLEILTPP